MTQLPHRRFRQPAIGLLVVFLLTLSCEDHRQPPGPGAATFSGQVVNSWLTMQLRLNATAPGPVPFSFRRYAYTAIALYESIVPGLADYQSIAPQLNGLSPLPTVDPGVSYYWPAAANAALAAMNRSFYPTTSAANTASVDSLEAANTALYQKEATTQELSRSADFGRKIAAAVFAWAQTDRAEDTTPYTPPTGVGLWVPTPPAFAAAIGPNLGKARQIVPNSDEGADQGDPIPYSEDPASAYYAQVKEVYDISQSLTAEQRTIALYWHPNSWLNVLNQVLAKEKPTLDRAAVAFAQVGISMSDAAVILFKGKYLYNGVRPITYIRTVLNQPDWNSVIPTPAYPEYPGGHSVTSGAAAESLTLLFGANYAYTDTPYNIVGVIPRSYGSFEEAALESADSRVYGGLHYRKTVAVSLAEGKIIARNVAQKVKFRR